MGQPDVHPLMIMGFSLQLAVEADNQTHILIHFNPTLLSTIFQRLKQTGSYWKSGEIISVASSRENWEAIWTIRLEK